LNQGTLGSCVANAFSHCIAYQTANVVVPSRLFHYANCRTIDFTPLNRDTGTTIRSACAAILNHGACQESVWPYNVANFSQLPPLAAYQAAKRFKTFNYTFVKQDLNSIKASLTTYKNPLIFGFLVYSSFMNSAVSKTGQVPLPNTKTETCLGGHCMTLIGFNDSTQQFICANCWGNTWGANGLCYIPYAYLLNPSLAADFCFTQFQGF
jgi:C1A family cysteine protease